ncbi:iron-containing alcohol dehydrogenase family protein [Alicyclobacillus sendaiensis]|uniref:iron-containing alcohol dehydrogenase family protein n=1 Tax=Alicyclobacillus sendaiensis TaxID=192387 RepID=UPI0007827C01|nr:iron-containing alcohol dehydrogenase [Alicyclobacillus sendaiensis]
MFTYSIQTHIAFGDGATHHLPEHLVAQGFGRRLLLVTDPGLVQAGVAERIADLLTRSGFVPRMFAEVRPNPDEAVCLAGRDAFLEHRADGVVAVGGGSSLDAGKAIALLARQGGTPSDYALGRRPYGPPAPVCAVPTTAGTGSEVTRSAVITEQGTHRKLTLKHEVLRPPLAVCDPALTASLPPSVTAHTGVDALVHAIEGATCKGAHPIARAYAREALGLIYPALPRAVHAGDPAARRDMLLGSLLAGLAFGSTDVASVHCLAEALGSLYDTPHGLANAVMLLPTLRYNRPYAAEAYAWVARAMGLAREEDGDEGAAEALLEGLRTWLDDLGIPKLRDLPGAKPSDFDQLATLAYENTSTPSNPRPMDVRDYRAVLELAYAD